MVHGRVRDSIQLGLSHHNALLSTPTLSSVESGISLLVVASTSPETVCVRGRGASRHAKDAGSSADYGEPHFNIEGLNPRIIHSRRGK
jgi:hypothetical protein